MFLFLASVFGQNHLKSTIYYIIIMINCVNQQMIAKECLIFPECTSFDNFCQRSHSFSKFLCSTYTFKYYFTKSIKNSQKYLVYCCKLVKMEMIKKVVFRNFVTRRYYQERNQNNISHTLFPHIVSAKTILFWIWKL